MQSASHAGQCLRSTLIRPMTPPDYPVSTGTGSIPRIITIVVAVVASIAALMLFPGFNGTASASPTAALLTKSSAGCCLTTVTVNRSIAAALPPIPPQLIPQTDTHKAFGIILVDAARLTPNIVRATAQAIMGKRVDEISQYLDQYDQAHPSFIAADGLAAAWPIYNAESNNPLKEMLNTPPIVLLRDGADEIAMMAFIEQYWPNVTKTMTPTRIGNWFTYLPKEKTPSGATPIGDNHKGDKENHEIAPISGDAGQAHSSEAATEAGADHQAGNEQSDPNHLGRMNEMKPRVELSTVLPLIMDRAAAIVLTPPQFGADDPKELDDVLNNSAGGDPMQLLMQMGVLIQRVQAVALWVEPGSSPAGTAQLQFSRQQIASKFADLFNQANDALKAIKASLGVNENDKETMAEMDRQFKLMDMILSNLECKSIGNTVVLSLNSQKFTPTAQTFVETVVPTRERAAQMERTRIMRRTAIAVITYAGQHDGNFPDSLEQVRDGGQLTADVYTSLTSPDHPTVKYVKPKMKFSELKEAYKTVILYELKDGVFDPKGVVAFADGHTEVAPKEDLNIDKQ